MAWRPILSSSDNSTNCNDWNVSGGSGAGYYGPYTLYSDDSSYAPIQIVQQGIPWVDPEPEPREWKCEYCGSIVAYKPAEDGKIACPYCSAPKEANGS